MHFFVTKFFPDDMNFWSRNFNNTADIVAANLFRRILNTSPITRFHCFGGGFSLSLCPFEYGFLNSLHRSSVFSSPGTSCNNQKLNVQWGSKSRACPDFKSLITGQLWNGILKPDTMSGFPKVTRQVYNLFQASWNSRPNPEDRINPCARTNIRQIYMTSFKGK